MAERVGNLLWKCRRCGKEEAEGPFPNVDYMLACIRTGDLPPANWPLNARRWLTAEHQCDEDRLGVMDLIGADVSLKIKISAETRPANNA